MNFKVIDGYDDDFEDIFDDFEKDYLNSQETVEELRNKYELSKRNFTRLTRMVKSKHGLSKRPSRGKHYHFNQNGFEILKKRNGELIYCGWIPISQKELVPIAIEICKKLQWDSEKCKRAIKELKHEGVHN